MIANIVQEQELVPMELITVRVNAVQNSMNYQFGEDEINLDWYAVHAEESEKPNL